jgi:hypothetical protein
MGDHQVERVLEKPAECIFGELAGGHREFTVFPRALAAHMALHPDIIGRICEDGDGLVSRKESAIGVRIQCASAKEAMRPEGPEVV